MAYSGYGAFVTRNGVRREDKEDVGVYDTEESAYPTGLRIFANIMKNTSAGTNEWWRHSHHGILGDGLLRVACYKQGLPEVYDWPDGDDKPTELLLDNKDDWDFRYNFGMVTHDLSGYKLTFTDAATSASGHYEAEMVEPDGTHWKAVYDSGYGAGHTEFEG